MHRFLIRLVACTSPTTPGAPAWTPIDTTGVAPRWRHTAQYDALRDRMIVFGGENKTGQLGQALCIAEGTVKNHISNVLFKLGARDRTQAVLRAIKLGLLAYFLVACGRLEFEPRDPAGEAGIDPDSLLDPCGHVVFADDFEDGVVDQKWLSYLDAGYSVAESLGTLLVTYAMTVGPNLYAGFDQRASVDMRNGCLRARLARRPNPATTAFAMIRLGTPNDKVQFAIGSDNIYAHSVTAGNTTIVQQATFDAINHQWVRFRLQDTVVVWETGPNGVDWNLFVSRNDTSLDPITATIEVGAATAGQTAVDAGYAAWDDVEERVP